MKKVLVFLVALTLISSIFTISVFAQEDADNIPSSELLIADESDTAQGYEPSSEEDGTSAAEEKNVFAVIYEKISLYTSEILSALTLIGSLVIAFTYKRGLLPTISGALSNIGNAVGKLREENELCKGLNEKAFAEVSAKLLCAEEMFLKLSDSLKKLEADLKENREEALKTQDIRTIMLAQIDMLYDIFMSSGLPVYQKDEISEKIHKMKQELSQRENLDEQA